MKYNIYQTTQKGEAKDSSKRKDNDFYPTPANVTMELLNVINIESGSKILEPCCGDGAISNILENRGYSVVSSDIIDYGYYNSTVKDFFNYSQEEFNEFDWLITNPPYNIADKILEKCITSNIEHFALLLPVRYLTGKKRNTLFKEYKSLEKVIVIPNKIDATGQGKPFLELAWFVFNKNYSNLIPQLTFGEYRR